MLPTQTPSDECSDDYRVQAGDPCVPAGDADMLSCPDLPARDIEIVGDDIYRLDGDDDGVGCDSPANEPSAAGLGIGDYAEPVGFTVALVVTVVFAVLWWRNHRRAADEVERRGSLGGIFGGIAIGAFAIGLGIVRWA